MSDTFSPEVTLPTSPEILLERLAQLGISYDLYHHPAVFTVAESGKITEDIPGTHCRNMFLCDKKKNMFLMTLANETQVDLKKIEPLIGSARLSFGSAERLWAYLGVRPGSVCPFAIINDTEGRVPLILDQWMMAQDRIHFHPLLNTMTVGIRPQDLLRFAASLDHPVMVCDLSAAAP